MIRFPGNKSDAFNFYADRIDQVPNYGLVAGDEILDFIIFCMSYDENLTSTEYWELLERVSCCYKKLLEVNYNEGW